MNTLELNAAKTVCDLNINRSDGKAAACLEQRAAHLYEKVRFLSVGYGRFSPQLPSAFRQMTERTPPPAPRGALLPGYIKAQEEDACVFDTAFTAKTLRGLYGSSGADDPAEYTGSEPYTPKECIAYLKNSLADSAYDMFAAEFSDPSVLYASDFESVCEAVYDEKAGYCILPIESSSDGRLAGFYGLIDKYELKIALCCRVLSRDGESSTAFVLCSRFPRVEKLTGTRLLEVQIRHDGALLRRLLNVASMYGLETCRCETLPSPDGNVDSVQFSGEDSGVCDLLYWLFLTGARYTLLGVYCEVSA